MLGEGGHPTETNNNVKYGEGVCAPLTMFEQSPFPSFQENRGFISPGLLPETKRTENMEIMSNGDSKNLCLETHTYNNSNNRNKEHHNNGGCSAYNNRLRTVRRAMCLHWISAWCT